MLDRPCPKPFDHLLNLLDILGIDSADTAEEDGMFFANRPFNGNVGDASIVLEESRPRIRQIASS